jgi:hypothetical protein
MLPIERWFMISRKLDQTQVPGSTRLPGVKLLLLSSLILLQMGCAAVKNYSISSYQGPMPPSEERYINTHQDQTKYGYPPYR